MKPADFLIPTPEDIDHEAVVLCGMLRDKQAVAELSETLTAEDFSSIGSDIFRAIMAVWSNTSAAKIDPELVLIEILKKSTTPADRWRESLVSILEADPSAAACYSRAKLVKERSIRKQLVQAAGDVLSEAVNPSTSPDESVSRAQAAFMKIGTAGRKNSTVTFRQAIREVTDAIDSGRSDSGLLSGLVDLDKATGGFHDGELCIIAARPGVGKSALAANIATNAAARGIPGLIISLEMSRMELASRHLCGRANIQSQHLRRGRLHAGQIEKLVNAAHEASELPLWINDSGTLRPSEIRALARRAKTSDGIRFVAVDYLQLITPEDSRSQRVEQVGEMSRSLKLLARDLEIPVICLAQLNRQVEQRNGKPKLSDLRESGSIEQDADTVIFLYRTAEPVVSDPIEKISVNVAKQRNGPIANIYLAFRKAAMTFETLQEAPTL